MLEAGTAAHFFLCANSPQGYLSFLKSLYDARHGWKAIILTGGPGEALTHLLAHSAEALSAAGEPVEYIHSCIEPSTLDAVAFPRLRCCVIDGNPPNHIEPDFPGLSESIFDLGSCLREDVLTAGRENILLFSARVTSSEERAARFLEASSSLLSDICRLALECADCEKIESYASNLARHEFPDRDGQGTETKRFLTALTADGQQNLFSSMASGYTRVYEVDDDYGIGKLFLNKMRSCILNAGYDLISCSCPMFPDGKPEHLLIPSLSTAFLTTGRNHGESTPDARHIHIRRFMDHDLFKMKRPRISFNRKASHELLDEAFLLLEDARANRRMIRSVYADALNPEEVRRTETLLTQKLLGLISH